jgi:hypothetical protein
VIQNAFFASSSMSCRLCVYVYTYVYIYVCVCDRECVRECVSAGFEFALALGCEGVGEGWARGGRGVGEGWARGGRGVGLFPPSINKYFPSKKFYIENK